eukprot:2051366-Pleurochrysis_carterae.AAC.1
MSVFLQTPDVKRVADRRRARQELARTRASPAQHAEAEGNLEGAHGLSDGMANIRSSQLRGQKRPD